MSFTDDGCTIQFCSPHILTLLFRYDRSAMPGISQFNGKQISMATTPEALDSLQRHIGPGYMATAAIAYLKALIHLHSFCVE